MRGVPTICMHVVAYIPPESRPAPRAQSLSRSPRDPERSPKALREAECRRPLEMTPITVVDSWASQPVLLVKACTIDVNCAKNRPAHLVCMAGAMSRAERLDMMI